MSPHREYKVIIEHKGVAYHHSSIFHDAQIALEVSPAEVERTGQRIGVQIMDTIDQWAKGTPPLPQRADA